MGQAVEYGDIPGAGGYFIIGYPEELKDEIRQKRIGTASPSLLLGNVTFRGLFKLKGEMTSLFRGNLQAMPEWLRQGLSRQPIIPNASEFIHLMHDIVRGLTDFLPSHGQFPSIFEHIIASMPKEKGEIDTARRASAYLLLNQVVFYRILQERRYPSLQPDVIKHPSDLKTHFFDTVLRDDYQAIFDFDVASLFPDDATEYIRDMVRIINELQPEQFTRDLLGNIFHSLIPLEVRKPVAAYYTNPVVARLLANLAIETSDDQVADFACGSGTLLMAAYDRKAELRNASVDEETHRRFVEHDITGIDIMPFAAHMAVVQLALRNPGYMTDRVRIAVYDSTVLEPNKRIQSLQRMMPHGQARIEDWYEGQTEKRKVRAGAVSGAGAGRGFVVRPVDVTIMNPPFTRKQLLKQDFRALLTERFKKYAEYTTKETNFFVYFVLLADKFLVDRGRIAMVLPATVLRQLSSKGVRELLSKHYTLEYIIQSGYRLAFSESTSFREILLVAKKHRSDKQTCVIARLGTMPTETNLGSVNSLLKEVSKAGRVTEAMEEKARRFQIEILTLPQETFRNSGNWQQLLPAEQFEGFNLPSSSYLSPLVDAGVKIVQGIRFHENSDRVDVKNTVLSKPRAAVDVKINWKIEKEKASELEAVSTDTGARVIFPRRVLRPTTRSPAGMQTIEITNPTDYVVVNRFPGDQPFWNDPDPDALLKRRLPHLKSREAFLVAAGRNNVNLASRGTHFLAFVSPEQIPPTWSFWSIKTDSLEAARLLALWWNSTFNLVQLMECRAEVGGSWVGWLKDTLLQLNVLKPAALTQQVRRELLHVYGTWKDTPFPSLLEQLESHFEGRIAIDRSIAKALGASQDETKITALYDTLAVRIKSLGHLLTT
jgi:tRNA1(Val) A37 N6-methylase TrmN6